MGKSKLEMQEWRWTFREAVDGKKQAGESRLDFRGTYEQAPRSDTAGELLRWQRQAKQRLCGWLCYIMTERGEWQEQGKRIK